MSYFLKDAGDIDEEKCETSCRINPDCGFYIHFSTTKIKDANGEEKELKPRCVCGQYATSSEVFDPESLPPTVTLKYKKGEPKQAKTEFFLKCSTRLVEKR